MKVYLSPSDQWSNIVADKAHSEAYHCTQIAKTAKKYLEGNGYTVKIGDNSKEGTYSKRAKDSNNWGADLHICIHTNAGGGEGTLMLAYKTSCNNRYVKAIYTEVANLTPTKDRGIQSRNNLSEINNTKAVCAYLEVDFHDNKNIENWIDSNIDSIGKAIAKGVCKADGKTFKSYDNTVSVPSKALYKVQCGAFKSRENANELSVKLSKSGFDNYVYLDNNDKLYKVQAGAYASKTNAEKQVSALKKKGFTAWAYRTK